jgi:hypothetical protein
MNIAFSRITMAVAALAVASFAHANTTNDAFVDLTDSVSFDGFNQLISSRITAVDLVNGITSNVDGGGDAVFSRLSGAHYPASQGLYSWSSGNSVFSISDGTVEGGISSIVFQSFVNISNGSNDVWGLLSPDNLPTLSFNGGLQGLAATSVATESLGYIDWMAGGVPMPADPNNPNYATFTWDLSGITEPITSYQIVFGLDPHSNALAFQVDQITAVPEPETYAMLCLGLGLIGFISRRRRHWPGV